MTARLLGKGAAALRAAVEACVSDGSVVGIGGQNISRCAVETALEIVRQGPRDLTLVGCNLSLHADLIVGAELARRLECGTGNLERFGVTHRIAAAIRDRALEVEDYDHATMLARLVAAGTGVPFLPVTHLEGSDLLRETAPTSRPKYGEVPDPWQPGQTVRVVPALRPDVAIVHGLERDADGNVRILGPTSHDPELIRAARRVLCTVERTVAGELFHAETPGTVISSLYFDAVIEMPGGAWPTATPGAYMHDEAALHRYQAAAKEGGRAYRDALDQLLARSSASP